LNLMPLSCGRIKTTNLLITNWSGWAFQSWTLSTIAIVIGLLGRVLYLPFAESFDATSMVAH
jgi:hypothetical protein